MCRRAAGGPVTVLGMDGYTQETYGDAIADVYDDWMAAGPYGEQAGARVTIGDFAEVPASGPFDLVYVVFNTLFALDSRDAQVRCMRNVARRLRPGGVFVAELFVPDVTRFDRDQRVQVSRIA